MKSENKNTMTHGTHHSSPLTPPPPPQSLEMMRKLDKVFHSNASLIRCYLSPLSCSHSLFQVSWCVALLLLLLYSTTAAVKQLAGCTAMHSNSTAEIMLEMQPSLWNGEIQDVLHPAHCVHDLEGPLQSKNVWDDAHSWRLWACLDNMMAHSSWPVGGGQDLPCRPQDNSKGHKFTQM